MKIIVPNTVKTYEDMIVSYSTATDWAFPVWTVSTTYYQGNMVSYNGKLYRCLEYNVGKQPDTYADSFWYDWGSWNNSSEQTWSAATAYAGGELVTIRSGYKRFIFKAISASTGVNPFSDTSKWFNIGAINIYRCVYGATENKTEVDGNVSITFDANKGDYFYMIGLNTQTATIEVKDELDNVLLTKSEVLSYKDASSWKDFFFKDFESKTTMGTSIPIGFNYKVTASLESTTTSRIGNVIIGKSFYLGSTLMGASAGILDFSNATRDADFGDINLVQGSFANRADITVVCESSRADIVKNFLTNIRSKEVLILGDDRDEGFEMLKIRGFVRDFNVTLSTKTSTEIGISIEGLI